MTARQSTASRPVFSASAVLEAVAAELATIKHEDRLTYSDLGALLGKSEDQAAKYCEATAEMGVVAYARAKREWNGRFTGALDRLCVESKPTTVDDRGGQISLLQAALALSVALADGKIDPEEVRANRATLESARDAIDAQLRKLGPAGKRA
jgi:hypothetical protein